jgi:poly-gamma-glutamate synthesis protein (capsule biosynthesis protein)
VWATYTPGVLRGPAALAAAGLAAALVASCTGETASPPAPSSGPASSSARPAATSPTVSSPTGSAAPGSLRLAFGGDVHFAAQVARLLDDPDRGLAGLRPYLATADLAMVNLETSITGRGTPAPKQFHFRAPPTALRAVAAAGVDVVTMANNHAVDYGSVGLADTLAAQQDSPIPVVGIGRDAAQAYAPAYLRAAGMTVAVLAATQVPDWTLANWSATAGRPGVASAATPTRLAAAVRAARARADVVVVYLHWGTDYSDCPNPLQRSTARALAAAGADVVLGAHAHRLQGAGWLGRTYVDYGLGNFVWWRRNSEADARSGVLTLSLHGRQVRSAAWTPMVVSADGLPRVPDAASTARLLRLWNQARACTGLSAAPPG